MLKAAKTLAGVVGYPIFGILEVLGGVVQVILKVSLWFLKNIFWIVSFLVCSITTARRWIVKPFDSCWQGLLAVCYLCALGIMAYNADINTNPVAAYIIYSLLITNLYSIAYEYGRWRYREAQKTDESARTIDPTIIDRASEIRDEIMAIQRPLLLQEIMMFRQKIKAAEDRGEIKPSEADKLYQYLFTRNDAVAS